MKIAFYLNNHPYEAEVPPEQILIEYLLAHHYDTLIYPCFSQKCQRCVIKIGQNWHLACGIFTHKINGQSIYTKSFFDPSKARHNLYHPWENIACKKINGSYVKNPFFQEPNDE